MIRRGADKPQRYARLARNIGHRLSGSKGLERASGQLPKRADGEDTLTL